MPHAQKFNKLRLEFTVFISIFHDLKCRTQVSKMDGCSVCALCTAGFIGGGALIAAGVYGACFAGAAGNICFELGFFGRLC